MTRHPRTSSAARGYDYAWQKLRAQHLLLHPLCAPCRRSGLTVPATTVDHVEPIRKAPHRRLDPTNLESQCAHCHSSRKQSEERGGRGFKGECDATGRPTSPLHHWNRNR